MYWQLILQLINKQKMNIENNYYHHNVKQQIIIEENKDKNVSQSKISVYIVEKDDKDNLFIPLSTTESLKSMLILLAKVSDSEKLQLLTGRMVGGILSDGMLKVPASFTAVGECNDKLEFINSKINMANIIIFMQ